MRAASESDLTLLDTVRRYEEVYGSGSFTGTKPPGLMVFYTALDHLANGYPSSLDDATRYAASLGSGRLALPLARRQHGRSSLRLRAPLPRRSIRPRAARRTAALRPRAQRRPLYLLRRPGRVSCASFCSAPGSLSSSIRRHSLVWAFLLGAVLYMGAFFAFTMLPLYVFAGLYLLLHDWRERIRQAPAADHPLRAWRSRPARCSCTSSPRTLLNYDFLPRFERTMSINHNFDFYLRVGQQPPAGPEPLGVRLGQILSAAWLNNLDFAAAIGFPIYILFLAQAVRRVWRFIKGQAAHGDVILLRPAAQLRRPQSRRHRAGRGAALVAVLAADGRAAGRLSSSNRTSASGRTSCWRLAWPSWSP